MKIVRENEKLYVHSIYHPDLIVKAKKLGRWNKDKWAWCFALRHEDRVEALYREIFGYWLLARRS